MAEEKKKKRKQKPKRGHVVRVADAIFDLVVSGRRDGETITEAISRLILGDPESLRFVLPSDLHETPEDARGVAVLRSVKRKEKRIERPLSVRIAK